MLCGCFVAQTQGGMAMVWGGGGGECARQACKASVQGEKSFIWGWGSAVWLPLAASLHKSKGEWRWLGGLLCERARRVCKASVQNERANASPPPQLGGSRSEKGSAWSSRSLGARCRNSVASCPDEQPHVGNYRLLRTIGKGNFAKVKLARHVLTGKEVRGGTGGGGDGGDGGGQWGGCSGDNG